jgi:hypothetical protein
MHEEFGNGIEPLGIAGLQLWIPGFRERLDAGKDLASGKIKDGPD